VSAAVADNVDFSPYASLLEDEARVALRALFELEGDVSLSWHLPSEGSLHVVLGSPEAPELEFDVSELTPDVRAWYKGERLALAYRKGRSGDDPMDDPKGHDFLMGVRRCVEKLDRTGWSEGPLFELLESLRGVQKFEEVQDYYFRQARPRELIIRLGFRCNQDCWFCWQGRQWPEPPVEYYHRWLEEAAAAGHRVVFFSGGEPTIHKELPELIRRSRKEFGMAAWVQTNAIQLGKPKVLQRMVAAGLNGVFVSYHASDATISDQMTRAPRTHALTERGIRACLEAGILVELNCVVERANYENLNDHAEHILEEFVRPYKRNPVRRVSYSHPHEYYDQAAYEHSVISLEKIQPNLSAAVTKLHNEGVAVEGIGTCGFPPCLLRENPAILRWLVPHQEHDADVDGRTYGDECTKCVARTRCLGVRREYLERCGEGGLKAFKKSPF
jgi:MoaA/NifB/PqqE/SkfB family radical SAM enzyme